VNGQDVNISDAQIAAIQAVLAAIHNNGLKYTFEGVAAAARAQHHDLLASLSEIDLRATIGAIFHTQTDWQHGTPPAEP